MKIIETIVLKGQRLSLRLASIKDRQLLQEGFSKLSQLSIYNRFHNPKIGLSTKELNYFLNIDNYNHLAIGAITKIKNKEYGIGMIRYIRDKEFPHLAEVALAVVDSHQNRGLGTALYKQVLLFAKENKVKTLTHYVLNENKIMIKLLKKFNCKCFPQECGVTKVVVSV